MGTQCRHTHTLSLFVLHTAPLTEYISLVSGARVGCSALSHCHYTLHYIQLHTNTTTPSHHSTAPLSVLCQEVDLQTALQ